jgi:hypothetical protein
MRDLNARANSSDTLRIVRGKEAPQVLKTYINHLDRSWKNIEKQSAFIPITDTSIVVEAATVINTQKIERGIELLMPYIEGYSGEDFAIFGTKDVAKNLSLAFSEILEAEFKVSKEVYLEKKIFIQKFEDVQDTTVEPKIKTFYLRLRKILDDAPNLIMVPVGICHGDLTLGNLIYHRNKKIILIDFLHTYLESPLQDVAKLNQEFKYCWSFRKSPEPLRLKGKIFLASARPQKLEDLCSKYSIQNSIFEMLNLLRIAPYLRDDLTAEWLVDSLEKFISEKRL